ncbi:hypothetical protein HA402_007621 [Bradysia odoriphaga]|nr:hypothetical protein HA402_007621 [Bradysia odoriphaga]
MAIGNKRMANRPPNGHNMRRFKPGNRQMNMGGIGAMFNIINNTNQIPSNGYLDFTEPTSNNNMSNNTNANSQKQFKNSANGRATNGNVNKNRNMQRRNNNGQRSSNGGMNNNMNGNNRWGNNNRGGMGNNNRNNNNRQAGNMMLGGQFNGPPRMHPMVGPNGPMLPPILPPLPMPVHNMNGRFPRPPPMGIGMGQGPIRPPSFRMGPGPFSNRGMMPRNNSGGPIRRNNKVSGGMVNKNNRRNGGNAQPSQKNRKKNQIKNAKRTNPNVNKYALDKPWVNDEIKQAHQVKTDLENQLKGKKNDEIFAKFKEQRDKFVSLYDAAKEAYVTTQKKDKEKVLKESDTGEQKDTNNDVELPIASAAS